MARPKDEAADGVLDDTAPLATPAADPAPAATPADPAPAAAFDDAGGETALSPEDQAAEAQLIEGGDAQPAAAEDQAAGQGRITRNLAAEDRLLAALTKVELAAQRGRGVTLAEAIDAFREDGDHGLHEAGDQARLHLMGLTGDGHTPEAAATAWAFKARERLMKMRRAR